MALGLYWPIRAGEEALQGVSGVRMAEYRRATRERPTPRVRHSREPTRVCDLGTFRHTLNQKHLPTHASKNPSPTNPHHNSTQSAIKKQAKRHHNASRKPPPDRPVNSSRPKKQAKRNQTDRKTHPHATTREHAAAQHPAQHRHNNQAPEPHTHHPHTPTTPTRTEHPHTRPNTAHTGPRATPPLKTPHRPAQRAPSTQHAQSTPTETQRPHSHTQQTNRSLEREWASRPSKAVNAPHKPA